MGAGDQPGLPALLWTVTPPRIALTGGIGSGKSAVSARFERLGAAVIDSDLIAREIVAPGEPGLAAIESTWGQRFLNDDGALDRTALRHAAFADAALKQRLDALLHPLIHARMAARVAAVDAPYVVLVIPLLIEAGFTDLADRVLLVDAERETRILRAMQRDGQPREAIEAIVDSQATDAARRAIADDIIDNNGPEATLDEQVSELHRRYLDWAREFTPPDK